MNVTVLVGPYAGEIGTIVGKSDVGSKDEVWKDEVWMVHLPSQELTLPYHPTEVETEEDKQRKDRVQNFMTEFSAYFAARVPRHSLEPDWFQEKPHPKHFNQGNSQRCIYYGLLIGYSFRGKDYGPDFYEEIAICNQASALPITRWLSL